MPQKSKCPFECIFDEDTGKLAGDCRIPWSDDCALNKAKKENNNNNDFSANPYSCRNCS